MRLTHAESTDSLGNGQERGYPWIAHSSVDAFYLSSPVNNGGSHPYQVSLYQGFTIQSLSFASFHLGLRSRDSYGPGFSQPYREPVAFKIAGTAEILRDYLYVSMGGNFPVYSGKIVLEDTLALYQSTNEYSPLPTPGFISPRALEIGVFGRYALPTWTTLGGFTYNRPARFDGIPGSPFFPASYFNFIGRALFEMPKSRHRIDLKATIYNAEESDLRIESHDEGDAWQLHYAYLHAYQKIGWQGGMGIALRLPDANRQRKLKSNLASTAANDNIQRAYAEFSLSYVPDPNFLWRFHLVPKTLFSVKEAKLGTETELGVGLGFKVWQVHRIRGGATFLYGNYAGKQYMGFGIKGEFAFRHLGFQDLEDQSDLNENAP